MTTKRAAGIGPRNTTARIPLVPIQRDNGRQYTPRKITCNAVHDDDGCLAAVIVFGTHDAIAARPFATESVGYWLDSGYEPSVPVAGWWRDAILHGDRTWVIDPVRGRAGVWFDVIERDNPPGRDADGGEPVVVEVDCEDGCGATFPMEFG